MAGDAQLYFGGDVYTVDESRPAAEAVAVRDGLIVAVGSKSKCEAALGKYFQAIDLKGRALLPGFIDTHTHPTGIVTYEMFGDMRGLHTAKDFIEKLRSFAENDKSAPWVVALQFEDSEFKEAKLPTRLDLDRACPDRPAIVVTYDGHAVFANTKAVEASGATAATVDPVGGKIEREPGGAPSGVFRETAAAFPLNAMPMPDFERIKDAGKSCFRKIVSHGITSLGVILQTDEEGVFGKQGQFDILLMNAMLDAIPVNLYSLLVARDEKPIEAARKTGLHNPRIGAGHRIGGLKFWADGTWNSCTAYMNEPFADRPDTRGLLMHSADEMYRRMKAAHNAGLQIAVHVIGDAATRALVDLFDRLLKEFPRDDHRHRLEHASILDEKLIADIARLNLVVSTSAVFLHTEKHWLDKRLGAERAAWTYPLRSLADAGVKIVAQSDAPVGPLDPLQAIQLAVTREGFYPQQCIDVSRAIKMHTIDAAFAHFEDSVKGSIAEGKRADFAILSANPTKVPSDKIEKIRVEKTVVGGKSVFESGNEI